MDVVEVYVCRWCSFDSRKWGHAEDRGECFCGNVNNAS